MERFSRDRVVPFLRGDKAARSEIAIPGCHSGITGKMALNREETAMKRSVVLLATAALGAALMASEPAAAFRAVGYHGRTFAGRSVAWRGAHWRGAHWRYGWRGAGSRVGWRRGWGGNRWGWNRGWGAGWPGYAGLGLAGLGAGWGLNNAWANYPYYSYGYGYPYNNNYGYGYGYPYAGATTAPLVTGRSVATGQMGNYCTTPAKTCLLYQESWVGNGCSCRVPGGRARGSVTP
jgi:hypothetical protein